MLATDAIQKPLAVIQDLFQQFGEPTNDKSDFGVKDYFAKVMKEPGARDQVPVLTTANVEYLPNNSLVRFRGMVQDTLNPEYYKGASQMSDGSWCTHKFSDEVTSNQVDAKSQIWERRPLYCIQIPSISTWDKPQGAPSLLSAQGSDLRMKRCRDDDMDTDGGDATMQDGEAPAADSDAAGRDQSAGQCCAVKHAKHAAGYETNPDTCKDQGNAAVKYEDGDCVVYLYDAEAEESIRLHDVVEVVGILSKVPMLAEAHMQCMDEMEEMEMMATHPPTSKVLRLHAISVTCKPGLANSAIQPDAAQLSELRAKAVQLLASALGGDSLAAEYMLMQLVASVTHRTDDGPKGILAMNLCKCPNPLETVGQKAAQSKDKKNKAQPLPTAPTPSAPLSPFGDALAAAVSALVPMCAALPLTVGKCNSGPWAPKRNHITNRFSRTPLQLPHGTFLMVDETVMSEGVLSEVGIQSLQTLANVLLEQKLVYDVEFHQVMVPTNIPATVLSSGRSLIKDALRLTVPLSGTAAVLPSKSDIERSVAEAEAQGWLQPLRSFLAASVQLEVNINKETTIFVQDEFVRCRKDNPTFAPEQFDMMLTLARLCARSFGESSLTQERWHYMMDLEKSRELRLKVAA